MTTPSYPAGQPAKVPAHGSIKRQIFDALVRGETLTPLDAWSRFGTSRLAALIHQLRVAGWPIHSDTITVSTAHGHQASIAAYSMEVAGRRAA